MNLPLKPGVTTTEFWTVIFCGLLLTAQAALSLTTVAWAAGGVTLLGLMYTYQRGKLKSQAAVISLEHLRREKSEPEA